METITSTITEQERVIRGYIRQVINNKQLQQLGTFFTDDCVLRTTAGRQVNSLQEYAQALEQIFAILPDLQVTINEMVVAGDTVAYRITAQGTQLGDYESIKPSQPAKDIRIEEAFFAQFKAGKISNVWILTDTHAMLQQLTAA
jgi:predicted ester cyclase